MSETTGRPAWAERSELEREYYDSEWGMPVVTEAGVYERLVLEGFQVGMSWALILRKRDAFREVFADFDPEVVAGFEESDIERLLRDERIVRNRRKIEAAVGNARATLALRTAEDLPEVPAGVEPGLAQLVWSFRPEIPGPAPSLEEGPGATSPESVALAKELRRRGFTFVGPTTAYALMQAIGIVNDHPDSSPRRQACAAAVKDALAVG